MVLPCPLTCKPVIYYLSWEHVCNGLYEISLLLCNLIRGLPVRLITVFNEFKNRVNPCTFNNETIFLFSTFALLGRKNFLLLLKVLPVSLRIGLHEAV